MLADIGRNKRHLWLDYIQDKDGKLSMDEFKEGSKKDPTILQALNLYDGMV